MMQSGQVGIYVHWPFCLSKCPYCDFNVHVTDAPDHARWRDAYLRALEHYAALMPGRLVRSVFFGGGTPSLMEPAVVEALLERVHALWPCANDMEVTLEANPTSIETGRFADFACAGVNRVSVGVQALDDAELRFLGRAHDEAQALAALEIAAAHFERFSFDLIYARPGQSLEGWQQELERAVDLARGGHLSLYQLTIERSTPFYFAHEQGRFSMPDEDLAAEFYLLTQAVTAQAGLAAYEVSNHSAPGRESAHNMIYWRYGDYIGIGPGAHGRLTLEDGVKYAVRDHCAPEIWLSRVGERGCGAHPFEPLDVQACFTECFMMGLRLAEGVPFSRLGIAWEQFLDMERLERAAAEGWLSYDRNRIVLSVEGRLRLNALVPYLLKSSAGKSSVPRMGSAG